MKKAIDTTGCCPTAKLVCDKSQCPAKPKSCKEPMFEVVPKPETPDSCCEEWDCVSPKNLCVVPVDGKNVMKAINDKWPTPDPCWSKVCAYGPDGKPTVTDQKQMCSIKCEPVSDDSNFLKFRCFSNLISKS
jgi:von Willebrand factor